MDYIDVRGPWPVYIKGFRCFQLTGKPRDISVQDAREVVRVLVGW